MAYHLDTNCVLRWLLNDNPRQARVVTDYLRTSKTKLQVTDLVFAEVAWVLKSVHDLDDIIIEGFLRKIVENNDLSCDRQLLNRVLDELNASPKVSFVDLYLAHYAGFSGNKLLTFDKTLAKKLPKLVKLAG